METPYIAVAEKDADSAFGIWFPDVEGCFSAGETLAEACANAAAAADVRAAAAAGAVLIAVPLSDADGINVSLDKNLVDQIDTAAAARGLTRSAFLAQAAREKIKSDAA